MRVRLSKTGLAVWLGFAAMVWIVAFTSVRASAGAPGRAAANAEKLGVTRKLPRLLAGSPARQAAAGQSGYAANGEKTCLDCHDSEAVSGILQSPHAVKADPRTPFAQHQCESCHGASPKHVDDPKANPVAVNFSGAHRSSVAARNDVCLTCHESGLRTHWSGSPHEGRGVACTDCHNVHAKEQKVLTRATQSDVCFSCHKEQRAQTHRISSHPLATTSLASAAKMVCADCHNPHGSTGPKLVAKSSVNETCYMCHAEKRGPFLWEHAPVTDDCTNCHTPHGSTNPSLLKTRVPLLCQQCHTGDHGAQVNSGGNLAGGSVTTVNGLQAPGAASPRAQIAARACLNCHVLIHGSNHPAGAKFQR
jgi:DmsE family decaheme c-type cytochrome